MASILRIKDENGEWVEVTAIKGASGATPVRGLDYWTEADIAEMKNYIDESILNGAW